MAGHFVQHLDSNEEEEIKHTPTIQKLQATIQSLNTTITRLRASREIHRSNNKTLTAKNKALEAKLAALTIKEEETFSEPLNSDTEEQPVKLTASTTTPQFLTKKSASTSAVPTIGINKKYPDVPNYYGDKAE